MEKGVGSGDPDLQQNVTDPQHRWEIAGLLVYRTMAGK
jgi:hypothetical protein